MSHTAHGKAVPAVLSPSVSGLKSDLSPVLREIATKVARKTIYEEIDESTAVLAMMLNYPRSEEGRIEYNTAAFDAVCAEGKIVDYFNLPKKARILWENIGHWLFHKYVSLDFLSNEAAKTGPNVLAPAIAGPVRQLIMGKLHSQFADIISEVL